MNVEIRKLANGYMVLPERSDRHSNYAYARDTDIYVFTTFASMIDKLQEILDKPEPKDSK